MDPIDRGILAEEKARERIEARMHERAPGTIRALFALCQHLNGQLRAQPNVPGMEDALVTMEAIATTFEAFEDEVSLGSDVELWAGHDVKPRDGA